MPIRLSIILPCYNETPILEESLKVVLSKLDSLTETTKINNESNIICVDDGSTDSTWKVIERCSIKDKRIQGIKLSRNVGQQNALLAGLNEAITFNSDAAISMDADLQDDIDAIDLMIDKFALGKEIVYGVRKDRSTDSFFKRKSANLFYNIMQRTDSGIISNHSDFRLMGRNAMKMLMSFGERNLFLRGMVPLIGLDSDIVYYERRERAAGKSKYPLAKMLSFAIEGITSFSVRPIRMIFTLGLIFLIITISVSIYVIISMLLGRTIPGWASIMLSLWFIGSLVLIALGIIGEYVSKIYLEVKNRPRYFIEKSTSKE